MNSSSHSSNNNNNNGSNSSMPFYYDGDHSVNSFSTAGLGILAAVLRRGHAVGRQQHEHRHGRRFCRD